MAESLADTVAALLRDSRAAHDRARDARSRKHTGVAHEELTLARSLRVQAGNLDPAHTAPAWGDATETKPTHDERMLFYHRQLDS